MEVQNSRSNDGEDHRRLNPFHQHRHETYQAALKCPRCDSLNTKFCYYNNYNFSQPRHYCKSCRRYWTIGGSLRNVPVGGGIRKSKNSKFVKPRRVGSSTTIPDPELNRQNLGNSSGLQTGNVTDALSNSVITYLTSIDESQCLAAAAISNLDNNTASIAQNSDFVMSSDIGSFMSLVTASNERLPFVFGYIQGMTPLKLNQLADYDDGIHNQEELEPLQPREVVEENLRKEGITAGFTDLTAEILTQDNRLSGGGYGWLDREIGGNEAAGAMDEASWFTYCGLNTPFVFDEPLMTMEK